MTSPRASKENPGRTLKYLVLLLTLLNFSCASLDSRDYRQGVLISTSKTGELIEREKVLGKTPGYFLLRRKTHPRLRIIEDNSNQEALELDLETSYRWRDSFFRNFVFLFFAPVGWGIDLLTGNAWNIKAPRPEGSSEQVRKIVIVPSVESDSSLREASGQVVERKLRELYPNADVVSYISSAPLFDFWGFNFEAGPEDIENMEALTEFNPSHFVLLEVMTDSSSLKFEVRDATNYKFREKHEVLARDLPSSIKEEMTLKRRLGNLFYFVPNTAFLNFAGRSLNINVDGQDAILESYVGDSNLEKSLSLLNSLSFSYLKKPYVKTRTYWKLSFVPLLSFSHKRYRFEERLGGHRFRLFQATVGYGPEVGLVGPLGYTYFNFLPGLSFTQVNYLSQEGYRQTEGGSVATGLEIGHRFFISSHFVATLFFRVVSSNDRVWRRAIQGTTGAATSVSSVSESLFSLGLGYHLP